MSHVPTAQDRPLLNAPLVLQVLLYGKGSVFPLVLLGLLWSVELVKLHVKAVLKIVSNAVIQVQPVSPALSAWLTSTS